VPPSTLIRPLGLCTQAIQLGILITFVITFHFNYLRRENVCVFYFCTFSNKLDLFEATCSIIIYIFPCGSLPGGDDVASMEQIEQIMDVCKQGTLTEGDGSVRLNSSLR
jgi:hypothetical protein